ncbi:MAG TPA: DUF86 domain-containing protein [Gemmataceae bacterium]|nr:DUF86 domain-containing protein [Gemmataceae bacterium]
MKDDRLYLIHISECIARIEQYTAGGQSAFLASTLIQDAVLRNLQTLAESTQRLSDALKAQYPQTDWTGISGFRNVLVHNYLGVDVARVWAIVENDLPNLKSTVQAMLQNLQTQP